MTHDQIVGIAIMVSVPAMAILLYNWLKRYRGKTSDAFLILLGVWLFCLFGLALDRLLPIIMDDPKAPIFAELIFND